MEFSAEMSLASRLALFFEKRVQFKGIGIFQARRVQLGEHSSTHVEARVQGTDLYTVRLRFEASALSVSCTCPYFADHGECKHLWATILESDRSGALSIAANEPHISIRYDDEAVRMPPEPVWQPAKRPTSPQIPVWQEHLEGIQNDLMHARGRRGADWPREFEVLYAIDLAGSKKVGHLTIHLLSRSRKKSGEWTAIKDLRVTAETAGSLPDPADAEAVTLLLGGQNATHFGYEPSYGLVGKALPPNLALRLLPAVAATGRLFQRAGTYSTDLTPVRWDPGAPWTFGLELRQDERDQWTITGTLRRGEESMDLQTPELLLDDGFLIANQLIGRFDAAGGSAWIENLRHIRRIPFPDREREKVLASLLSLPVVPPMEVDPPLRFEQRQSPPRLGLRIVQRKNHWGEEFFEAQLLADYGHGWDQAPGKAPGIWMPEDRVYVRRDEAAEESARRTLSELGLRSLDEQANTLRLPTRAMPRVVRELLHAGWHVEAEGKAFRRAGATRVDVSSGIDWFELRGEVDYGGVTATLPQLLAALRRGDTMVRLGDGTFGMLPEEWISKFAPLAGLGDAQDDHLRFRRNQAGVLDALLAAQPEVRVDEAFARVRERLRGFHGVTALPQPAGMIGHLRDYQCEGLGWMQFLREFGFGGCLADDMGVGKTAQVLATLEMRRAGGCGPSLVVAPKSLMFNWRAEAAKFTPELRVIEHTGMARDAARIGDADLVLTTYGTLVRDVPQLAEVQFDYVVLDEAQAIKNANTASAKAVRLLRGTHRLALSGTPVENHLGELWSLFEFLNPGMLGEAKVLKMAGGLARNPGEEARQLLAHALRPFILRRTKQQVARELPPKTEQTIFCELEPVQRKQYDDLRRHYRDTLLRRVQNDGVGKATMHVLEALLRLRQAACHPGLLDEKRKEEPSAKLDVLLDHLDELREEGHKALVFSQFTSLLAIVRERLDEAGVRYEYLDGATRDRQARVDTFQNDPACSLFLVSLKAGGVGLNLTAAEYVFLLDPWWNPAVEAQAIDRTHRIGQSRPVFAYRLIARDTVEEKVLELQKNKRDLADAILGEDNSLIRDLKREDLEMLLS
jgi:superfamily II DNA or RNA helicase